MVDEKCGGTPHKTVQCTDHEFLKDGQQHNEVAQQWQDCNGGIKDELAIGASDGIAIYLHKSKGGKEFKDQKNVGIKQCEEVMELYLKKENAQDNKACINDDNSYSDLMRNNHEKHEEEVPEKDVLITNSEEDRCDKGMTVCSENVQTEEKEAVVDEKEDENKQSVIGCIDATVAVGNSAKSDNIAGITIQPKNIDSGYKDRFEKKTVGVSVGKHHEKNDAEIDVRKRDLNKQNPKWRHPKCRKQRKARRIHKTVFIKRCAVTYTILGVLKATGGSEAKSSSSSNTNTKQNTSNMNSRRRSIQRHQSGGGDGKLDGGGCGGEPPTPPDEDWKKKPPCDGPVVKRKYKRQPSKKLPPAGVQHVPPSEFITEDFLQPALEHFHSGGGTARWLTHNCPPCKTMQAYLNHVQKCEEDLWHTCQICSRLFDEVHQWVERCQQSEHAVCYIPFCREFYQVGGQEAQFCILRQFAKTFDKPGPNFTQPIGYPIQREQSLTENPTAMEILDAQVADKPPDLGSDSPVRSTVTYGSNLLLYHEDSQNKDLHLPLPPLPPLPARNASQNIRCFKYVRPRQQVPVTANNKAAFVDFYMNKPYDTGKKLKHVEVGDSQPDEIWKHDMDEEEGLTPVRNQVRYGEKRHLMAFLPFWMSLQRRLRDGGNQPEDLMTENDEGILFNKGLQIQDGHYRQGEEYIKMVMLGRGSFGMVHQCKDDNTHFEFVVKMIALDNFNPNEAIIWSDLDHPGIVRLLGVVRIGTNICFFSEYVAERTLKSLVENGRVLSQGDTLYYLDQLLWILDYLQKKKVVHKDLKPENVLVTGEGRLLLIDWGLARVIRKPPLQSEQNPEGTQYYMAPEVARSQPYDFGVDIWSLMCIGIHLISGYPPWIKRYSKVRLMIYIVGTKSPPVEDIPEDTHPQVKHLLELGMTVEPSDRPNAEQLMQHKAFNLIHQLQEVAAVNQFQELDIAQCKAPPSSTEDQWPYFAPAPDDVNLNSPSFSTSCQLSALATTSYLSSPTPQCIRDGVAISSHDLPGQNRMQNAPSNVDGPRSDSASSNMILQDIILATPVDYKLDSFAKLDPGISLSSFSKPGPDCSPITATPNAAHELVDHDKQSKPNMYDGLHFTSVDSNTDLYSPCDVFEGHTRHTASSSTSAEKQSYQVESNECKERGAAKDVRHQYGELTEETTNLANSPISAYKTRGQPASLGIVPTSGYTSTSKNSLPGRLRQQRRSITLAHYFSEAPLHQVDPVMPTVGTTDELGNNQCRQVKNQSFRHQMEYEEPIDLPTSMHASNQLPEFKEPIDLPTSMQASNQLSELNDPINLPSRIQDSNQLAEFNSERLANLPAELEDQQGMELRQFLNDDEDICRFQGPEELLGATTSGAHATSHLTSSLNAALDDSYVTAGMTTSSLMLSADELDQEFLSLASYNLMQQATGEESPETQLELMSAVTELQSQYSSSGNHNRQLPDGDNMLDERFTPALSQQRFPTFTSGVYSSASPHLSLFPMVPHGEQESVLLSALQKQLSTVSSASSNDGLGIRVCVLTGNGPDCISILMRRGQSIGDLAVGISAKVLNNIAYFTLTTEDGKFVADNDTIGTQALTLVLNADPPDGYWQWRVDVNKGTIDYA